MKKVCVSEKVCGSVSVFVNQSSLMCVLFCMFSVGLIRECKSGGKVLLALIQVRRCSLVEEEGGGVVECESCSVNVWEQKCNTFCIILNQDFIINI